MTRQKILTLCAAGNNRSVATGYLLKHRYRHDSIAAGVDAASPETLRMLATWADRILICGEESLISRLPVEFHHKVTQLGVGPDRWSPSYHPELLAIVKERLLALGLISLEDHR